MDWIPIYISNPKEFTMDESIDSYLETMDIVLPNEEQLEFMALVFE